MKVLIVAKTRQHPGACVGAISFAGESLRLISIAPERDASPGMEYNIGDTWEIKVEQPNESRRRPLPHTEDVIVLHKRPLPPLDDPIAFIYKHSPPYMGPPDGLFDGLLQRTASDALYIAERTGVPSYSTTFWVADRPLVKESSPKRIRYRYTTSGWSGTLTFVGFQDAEDVIPAGSLIRVSLAHWWRPEDSTDELRCYAQLSGWYEQEAIPHPAVNNQVRYSATSERTVLPSLYPQEMTPMPSTPNLTDARATLKTVFGYDTFRPLQAEVIGNVLSGRDTLLVMPTGGGKSLCYQLPALLLDGLTVVVSPLISLMQDQVEQLQALDVPAVYLNSTLSYTEYGHNVQQVRSGAARMLYVAPETLLRPETLALLAESRVACLTIDEAHCISQWGHDFRPEYRQILDVRQRLPQAVCVAVTATATPRVQEDIQSTLAFSDANTFIASFDRPNLMLNAQLRQNGPSQVLEFLAEHENESGIIYCATRKDVDTLTGLLTGRGIAALPYHAGLDDATRQQNQRRFIRDQVPVMVATIAFGMGIDKPDVRFIVHYSLPKDLESYYQQIGRAGRDGLPSDCLLLYSAGDVGTNRYFIQQQAESEQRGASLRLQAMLDFAETLGCRRTPLLGYFGESYEPDDEGCGQCDNCLGADRAEADLTLPAQKFLSCVYRTGARFGVNHIIDVLRGSRAKRVLELGHDRLSTYNIGADYSKEEWKFLARQFVQQGLLEQDLTYGSLSLTPKAHAVFKGEKVRGLLPAKPAAAQTGSRRDNANAPTDFDRELFQQLRRLRLRLAEEENVPPYVVFGDRSLMEMAAYFPQSPERFLHIYGVGQAKVERYAGHFLPAIRAYCAENGLAEQERIAEDQPPAPPARVPSLSLGSRTYEVALAFNDGRSVPTIAQDYGVQPLTVIEHLWKYAQAGNELSSDGVAALSALDAASQEKVLAVFAEHGPNLLRPVYEALGEQISYDELHILRIVYLCRRSG